MSSDVEEPVKSADEDDTKKAKTSSQSLVLKPISLMMLTNGENNMKNTKLTRKKQKNSQINNQELMLKKRELLSQKVAQLIALVI